MTAILNGMGLAIAIAYVLTGIILIYLISHFLLGRRASRDRPAVASRPTLFRPLTLMLVVLISIVLPAINVGTLRRTPVTDALLILGVLLQLGGALLYNASVRVLGANWSDKIIVFSGHRLITAGPYSYTRHPIFLSSLIVHLGVGLMFRNWIILGLWFPLLIGVILRMKEEEATLVDSLAEYSDYQKKVAMLVPRIPALTLLMRVVSISSLVLGILLFDREVILAAALLLFLTSFMFFSPYMHWAYRFYAAVSLLFALLIPLSINWWWGVAVTAIFLTMGLFGYCPGCYLYCKISGKQVSLG